MLSFNKHKNKNKESNAPLLTGGTITRANGG